MGLGTLANEIRDAMLDLQGGLADTDGNYPTFTWRGSVQIKCVPDMATRGTVAVFGGQETTVQFSLNVLAEYFLTVDTTLLTVDSQLYTADNDLPRPVAGMFLDFRGRKYRILTAGLDSTGAFFNLALSDKNSGR